MPSSRKLKSQPQKHFGLSIFIHIRVKMYAKEKPTSKTRVMSTFEYIREKPTSKNLVMSIIAHIRLKMCDKSRTDS